MKHAITFYHLFFALMLVGSIITIVVLVPPESSWLVMLLIGLISFASFYVTAMFTENRNTRVLVGLLIAAFLGMNAAIGFSILNTALLLSFIIGLKLLLK